MPPKPPPPRQPDSDGYGEAARRPPERVTLPRVPATPGWPPRPPARPQPAPPPDSVPTLLSAPELEDTPPSARSGATVPPVRPARGHQATSPGFPAPPASGGPGVASRSPAEPPAGHRQATEPRTYSPPPVSSGELIANPYDNERTIARAREAAARRGEVLHDPPPPSLPAKVFYAEPPWWRSGKGLALVLGGTATLVTALAGGAVVVIKALRETTDGARVKDIAEAKKAGEECQAAVASERKATLAREEELASKLAAAERRTDELARAVPAVKANPLRAPK